MNRTMLPALLLLTTCSALDKPIGELAPYDPCAGAACGEPCKQCDPDDDDCVEPDGALACDLDGQCVPATSDLCEPAPPPYDPCADKSLCDVCTLCPPDGSGCAEDLILKVCDASSRCVSMLPPECTAPNYEPCAGRPCGATCNLCAPDEPGCAEDAIYRACDAAGVCAPKIATCP